jgi:hypothetical protein
MNLQQEVIKWWHSGRQYQQGVMLFSRLSKKKALIHYFMKKHARFAQGKLEYELAKAAGFDRKNIPDLKSDKPAEIKEIIKPSRSEKTVLNSPANYVSNYTDIPSFDRDGELPLVVRRLKYEYSDLYNKRCVIHQQMKLVPESNSIQNMAIRASMLKEIISISSRADFLYGFIHAYEKQGVMPLEEQIWPKIKIVEEIPASVDDLKKMKKNLQSANTKDRNQLQFQQKSKAEKENLMPDGPKKKRVMLRIKHREEKISLIDNKIFEIENAG